MSISYQCQSTFTNQWRHTHRIWYFSGQPSRCAQRDEEAPPPPRPLPEPTLLEQVEYWHGTRDKGTWLAQRPPKVQYRVDAAVHESSTLHLGDESDALAPVDARNYQLRGADNVFVTGSGLWPRGGSWNPTLTMTALALDLADKLVGLHICISCGCLLFL